MARSSKQKRIKKLYNTCVLCDELVDYSLLDTHRILEGGEYSHANAIPVCVVHHRKIHTGQIKILGKHLNSMGSSTLHYIDETGQEQWKIMEIFKCKK